MRQFTIEFFYDNEKNNNNFLRLMNDQKFDIEITYAIEDSNACIKEVIASDNYGSYDITETCKICGAMPELQYACEFDLTGKLVRQMFDNYPRLNDPALAHLNKEEMIKKLDQESNLHPHFDQILTALNLK